LAEIEAALASLDGVAGAAATVRADESTGPVLAGYVVPATDRGLRVDELAAGLRRLLPAPLVPSLLTIVPALPVTAHGKVDRPRLPAPDRRLSPHEPPATDAERAACDCFARVLGLPGVGAADDFFALGGHSLLAIRLAGELELAFGSPVSVRAIL